MSVKKKDKDMVLKFTASYDKETKSTYRYLIDSNDFELSGTLYFKKDKGKLPEKIKLKAKLSEDD